MSQSPPRTIYAVADDVRPARHDLELRMRILDAQCELTAFVDDDDTAAAINADEARIAELQGAIAKLEKPPSFTELAFTNVIPEGHTVVTNLIQKVQGLQSNLQRLLTLAATNFMAEQLNTASDLNSSLKRVIAGANAGEAELDMERLEHQAGERGLMKQAVEGSALRREVDEWEKGGANHKRGIEGFMQHKNILHQFFDDLNDAGYDLDQAIQVLFVDLLPAIKKLGGLEQLSKALHSWHQLSASAEQAGESDSLSSQLESIQLAAAENGSLTSLLEHVSELDRLGGLATIKQELDAASVLRKEVDGLRDQASKHETLKQTVEGDGGLRSKASKYDTLRREVEGELALGNGLRYKALKYDTLRQQVEGDSGLKAKASKFDSLRQEVDGVEGLRATASKYKSLRQEMEALKAEASKYEPLRQEVDGVEGLRATASKYEPLRQEVEGVEGLRAMASKSKSLRQELQEAEEERSKFSKLLEKIASLAAAHLKEREQAMGEKYDGVFEEFKAKLTALELDILPTYFKLIANKEVNLRKACKAYAELLESRSARFDAALVDMEANRDFWRAKCRQIADRYVPGALQQEGIEPSS